MRIAVVIPEFQTPDCPNMLNFSPLAVLVPGGSNIEEDPSADTSQPQEREIHAIDEGKAPFEI